MYHMEVNPDIVAVTSLSSSEFAPFGHVIEDPAMAISPLHDTGANSLPKSANQGTALKFSDISPVINNYKDVPNQQPSKSVMSLFVCSPKPLKPVDYVYKGQRQNVVPALQGFLDLSILERHPYTTQTFVPLGLDPKDPRTAYLVVVAPTDADMPDLSRVRAFLARGSQAVTYATGTWHAPMTVIGDKDVAFVVSQHMNGIAHDDCEEVKLVTSKAGGGVLAAIPCVSALPQCQPS